VENVFYGSSPIPYLKSVEDPHDELSPKHRWTFRFTTRQMQSRLKGYVKGGFRGVKVRRRGMSPRVVDAVVVGSYLISLLNHADRVAIACQAQLVNIIAPILTEPGGRAWRQTIFHPFAQAARLARGRVLRLLVDSPLYATERFGEVPLLHATATYDDATGDLCVFAVNRSATEPMPLRVDLRGFGGLQVAEHSVLADEDLQDCQDDQYEPGCHRLRGDVLQPAQSREEWR